MLAAPAVGDALATLAVHGPAFLAAVAVVVVGHLLGVVGQDLIGRSARVVSTGSEPLVRRTTYAVVLFLSIVLAQKFAVAGDLDTQRARWGGDHWSPVGVRCRSAASASFRISRQCAGSRN
jgi:hypothetical protein